jgi:DNA topoisomerase-2
MEYNKDNILDYTVEEIPYEEFIQKDLIHFSNRDLERSIPNICDGLKESTRKILYGCLKRKLYSKEIKVAQLSGYISEVSAYHHGETSLQKAIIGMAQNYVGTNNINIMKPVGQFGTRIQGGEDAASPRYIHTMMTELARLIFRQEDNPILKRLEDDGKKIEPEYYTPIIPMVLVNGGIGIGTGFSTNIPQHNPSDIIKLCNKIIDVINTQNNMETKEDVLNMYNVINKVKLGKIEPWYLGFKGTIKEVKDGSYASGGVWNWLDEQTLEITELPVGTWTEDYKNILIEMIQNGSQLLKDFENHYTDKKVHFILKFYPGVQEQANKVLETEFKLVSTKNLGLNNMHLYSADGAVRKYEDTNDIIKEWSKIRLMKYYERKKYQLKELNNKYQLISAKVRFIQEIINKTLIIMDRKEKEVEEDLINKGYPKLVDKIISDEEENEDAKKPVESYDYLTNMPIKQLTYEKKKELEKEANDLNMRIKELTVKSIQSFWSDELNELSDKWEEYKNYMEAVYTNDDVVITPKRKQLKRK